MADDTAGQDDQFQTNNPDDTNPAEDMKQDEALPNDVSNNTPFSPSNNEGTPVQDSDSGDNPEDLYYAGPDAATGESLPSSEKVPSANEE